MAEEGLRTLSRGQSLVGLSTWLGGVGKALLTALEMQRFLLDVLPQDLHALFTNRSYD